MATRCPNACSNGTITMTGPDGKPVQTSCGGCDGSGWLPTPVDNEDNGRAGGH